MFREGGNPVAGRSALPPVFVTAAERDYYCDDKNKTIQALKAEFEELHSLIPEPSVIGWQLKMRSAKRHKDVEEVLQQLRDFKFLLNADFSKSTGLLNFFRIVSSFFLLLK